MRVDVKYVLSVIVAVCLKFNKRDYYYYYYRSALNAALSNHRKLSVCVLSVCPSVRQTRAMSQSGRKICPDFLYIHTFIITP